MIDSAEEFFGSISIEEFQAKYWRKRPVQILGSRDKIKGLFDVDKFFEYCSHPEIELYAASILNEVYFQQIPVTCPQAKRFFRHGFTIQCEDLHRAHPGLMELANKVRDALGIYSAMEAGVFLAPPGIGFGTHFDPNPDIWTIQLKGTKRWVYSEERGATFPLLQTVLPPEGQPIGDPSYTIERPDLETHITIDQNPGDIFYFPGGCWHSTETLGTEDSCHVVIASINETFSDLVFDTLRPKLNQLDGWRDISGDTSITDPAMNAILGQRLVELKSVVDKLSAKELLTEICNGRELRRSGSYRQSSRHKPRVQSVLLTNP